MNSTLSAYMKLFERCPEMRPKQSDDLPEHTLGIDLENREYASWICSRKDACPPESIRDTEALALCFKSAAEWYCRHRTTMLGHYGASWVIKQLNGDFANQDDWHGIEIKGSLDLALIAACEAVLDGQKGK